MPAPGAAQRLIRYVCTTKAHLVLAPIKHAGELGLELLPGLKEWEGSRSRTAPHIVLISTGTPEQNRAMGLRSPVLLDQGQGAMGLFGASGTPSALLVDRSGNIASSLAIGADAIFALAGKQESTVTDKTGMAFGRIEQQLT